MKCRSRAPGHSVFWKGILRTFTVQGLTLPGTATEKRTLMLGQRKIMIKSLERKVWVKDTGSQCMHKKYA